MRSNGCCTPIVHEALPTVIASSQLMDTHQLPALNVPVYELPASLAIANIGHRIESDTGPPPEDLVVTLQRLVI